MSFDPTRKQAWLLRFSFQVFAVSRSRVPVVKACAPPGLWHESGRPSMVDISVNNMVAVHNTRLIRTYTNMVSCNWLASIYW